MLFESPALLARRNASTITRAVLTDSPLTLAVGRRAPAAFSFGFPIKVFYGEGCRDGVVDLSVQPAAWACILRDASVVVSVAQG